MVLLAGRTSDCCNLRRLVVVATAASRRFTYSKVISRAEIVRRNEAENRNGAPPRHLSASGFAIDAGWDGDCCGSLENSTVVCPGE